MWSTRRWSAWLDVRRRSHPVGTARDGEREGQAASPATGSREADGPTSDSRTADLDTEELCRLWRVTSSMVRDLRAPARTLRVVELREEILDELERRHPEDLRSWLTSDLDGADDPSRDP